MAVIVPMNINGVKRPAKKTNIIVVVVKIGIVATKKTPALKEKNAEAVQMVFVLAFVLCAAKREK